MRNPDLDKKLPIDEKISDLKVDEKGDSYRIVNGKKIYQMKEVTQHDIDMNLVINRYRASK